jgi:DNA-directed RNA polymerase specialized sigma24 family protein
LKRGGTALHDSPSLLEEVMSREPDPALAAEMADRCDQLMAALPAEDADLRRIALLRMEGYSVEEVGEKVGFSPRSVKRKLGVIRKIWLEAEAVP